MKSIIHQYLFLLSILLLTKTTLTHSKSFGVDVYDNIRNCPINKSGPECDIPYESCDDKRRLCFNNSKCTLSTTKDPVTNERPYICDCAYATTRQSRFAGMECEHSETNLCSGVKVGHGSTFCTNGGQCMDMTLHGKSRGGCACPYDFVGAHCQYLREDAKDGGLAGEALFSDVADNYWSFVPEKTKSSKATAIAIGVSISAFCMITLALVFAMKKIRRKKNMEEDDHHKTPVNHNNIEADGSATMKGNELL